METKFSKALTFTVTKISQNSRSDINSPPFSSGGCEWIVTVNPKGSTVDNYLSLFLSVNEPKSLGLNWKRKASFYFALLNQSRKQICRTSTTGDQLFYAEGHSMGYPRAFPLEKVLENGVLVNDSFIIEIYIKVVEVFDGSIDVNGFQVLSSSHATLARQIFVEHPDIATDFKSKNQVVKTAYMHVLLGLLETVKKPLKSITKTDLSNAQSELCELTEVGFKLEWLKTKLEEISLASTEGFQIQQLEEQVNNLELNVSGLKVELDKEKEKSTSEAAKVLSLEQKLSDLKIELAYEKTNFLSLKEAFYDLRVELEKEKAKSTSVAAKALSLKETWSGFKVKGNSEITDNLLSWEDGDLV